MSSNGKDKVTRMRPRPIIYGPGGRPANKIQTWQCNCSGKTFYIHSDKSIVCSSCKQTQRIKF